MVQKGWKRVATGIATSGISELMRPGAKAAEAAGKAAEEQAAIAREGLAFQKESRDMAVSAAEPTLDELNSINNMLKTRDIAMNFQLKNIDNQLTLLNSVDPALGEAETQAYQLLQGQERKYLLQ